MDVQRILARSVAGAAAREQLEKDKAAMQSQLDGQKTELEKLRDELEKKGQLLSADARREKQDAIERKVRDVRRLVDDLQTELQKKEDALLQKVLQDVAGLIQRLGKDEGLRDRPRAAARGRALRLDRGRPHRRRPQGLRRPDQEGHEVSERRRLVHARPARRRARGVAR